MKFNILLIFICVAFSFNCSRTTSLYYQDNTSVEKEMDSIEGCEGVAEAIRNNFFFNKADSLYVENFGFFMHGLINEYYDCLQQLNAQQITALFGVPHFEKDNSLYYIIKSNGKFYSSTHARVFVYNGVNLLVSQSPVSGSNLPENIDQTIQNPKLKKAKFLERKETYEVDTPEKVHDNCIARKQRIDQEVFYHKKRKYHVVNSLILSFIHDTGYEIPCAESFTKEEIYGLFGKPSYQAKDTLYYHVYDKPYKSQGDKNKEWNGMIYCVYFTKSETGFYKFSTGVLEKTHLKMN